MQRQNQNPTLAHANQLQSARRENWDRGNDSAGNEPSCVLPGVDSQSHQTLQAEENYRGSAQREFEGILNSQTDDHNMRTREPKERRVSSRINKGKPPDRWGFSGGV